MATTKKQRIGIWVIAITLTIGTIGSFAVMILANENQRNDQMVYAEYQREYEAYSAKMQDQADELSDEYYPIFSNYSDLAAKFKADSVTELKTTDLLKGSGETIDDETAFAAYYIGWNPDGKVFDQSIEGESLKAPLAIDDGLAMAGLIEGWKKGMIGMKIGGVRVIEIPSDLAYGEMGQGEDIPPNTPIKFVVMAIEKPETIKQPDVPAELQGGM